MIACNYMQTSIHQVIWSGSEVDVFSVTPKKGLLVVIHLCHVKVGGKKTFMFNTLT